MIINRFHLLNSTLYYGTRNKQIKLSNFRTQFSSQNTHLNKYYFTNRFQGKIKNFKYNYSYLLNQSIRNRNSISSKETSKLETFTSKKYFSSEKQGQKVRLFDKKTNFQMNYNDFQDMNALENYRNRFSSSKSDFQFQNLSYEYNTINENSQSKKQLIESLLLSSERNLYKIVEQCLIVLEAFARSNRKDELENNIVKVIKQFNNKLIQAYLQNIQLEEQSQLDSRRDNSHKEIQIEQSKDNQYELHNNYISNRQPFSNHIQQGNSPVNKQLSDNFIFYYIETMKDWLLNNIDVDDLIRLAQTEIDVFLTARQVSSIQDTLENAVKNIVNNYIKEQNRFKRQSFPFDKKLRSICLIPYMKPSEISLYFDRLTQENLVIYLNQSQIINLMYDITEIKPELKNTQPIYQVQNTKVYQNISNLNAIFIKSRFVHYVRNFMVCLQQIQFYEIFREVQSKIKYPSTRLFIRLIKSLKAEADDLHCEFNKVMNKYNYNSVISIIISQPYNIDNTKLEQLIELILALNNLQKSGEILFDQLTRYLKQYIELGSSKKDFQVSQKDKQSLYQLFTHLINQAKPVYKYQNKDGLNKQFGRKTINLINIIFDILLPKYPDITVIGYKFLKTYINPEQAFSYYPIEQKTKIQKQNSEQRMKKISECLLKLIENQKLSIEVNLDKKVSLQNVLQTILYCLNNTFQISQKQGESKDTEESTANSIKMLYKFITQVNQQNPEGYLCDKILEPLLIQIEKQLGKSKNSKQKKQFFQLVYQFLQILNIVSETKNIQNPSLNERISKFVVNLQKRINELMIQKLEQFSQKKQKQRNGYINPLNISAPGENKQILLVLGEIIKIYQKNQSVSGNSDKFKILAQPSFQRISKNLNTIYSFVNNVAISSLKSLEQSEIFNMLKLFKNLEILVSVQNPILLLEFKTKVYEYTYGSLSAFIIHITDRGKNFLKFNARDAPLYLQMIENFVEKKSIFKGLRSKKKLVMLQIILAQLIKKKYLKLNNKHLKRSEHSHILLSFMQIFEFTQNITVNLRKVIEEIQFTINQLQEFPKSIIQRFSQINLSICMYLEDNKVNLTSPKKLNRLSVEQLKKEFKSEKIYEMIVRNPKFVLPFALPEPITNNEYTKLMYIIEIIYQKIRSFVDYQLPRKVKQKKKSKKLRSHQTEQQMIASAEDDFLSENQLQDPISSQIEEYSSQANLSNPSKGHFLDLSPEIGYIKRYNLVNHAYQDHYKLSEIRLPFHYKKQVWKMYQNVSRDSQVESIEIDQKIDQNVYKMVLLALIGYTEKVKLVAKQFHSHTFVQYAATQLDMQIFTHGCVTKISRKNPRSDDNVLIVSTGDHNYKLLYICTHILRTSGENAYLLTDKFKETDFKEFLQHAIPHTFESEQEMVQKLDGIQMQDSEEQQKKL